MFGNFNLDSTVVGYQGENMHFCRPCAEHYERSTGTNIHGRYFVPIYQYEIDEKPDDYSFICDQCGHTFGTPAFLAGDHTDDPALAAERREQRTVPPPARSLEEFFDAVLPAGRSAWSAPDGTAPDSQPDSRSILSIALDDARWQLEQGAGGDLDAEGRISRVGYVYVPSKMTVVSAWLRLRERYEAGTLGGDQDGEETDL